MPCQAAAISFEMFQTLLSSSQQPFGPQPSGFTRLRDCQTAAQELRSSSQQPFGPQPSGRLPFGSPAMLQTFRSSSQQPFGPEPSGFTGLQDSRLAALKCSKPSLANGNGGAWDHLRCQLSALPTSPQMLRSSFHKLPLGHVILSKQH